MRNTGWVRKSLVRRQRRRQRRTTAPPRPAARAERRQHRRRRAPAVVVSSQAIATRSASTSRRLIPALGGRRHHRGGPARHHRGHRVEERVVRHLDAAPRAARPRAAQRVPWVRRGDRPQPVRAVVDRVHARHHGQQHLRGADVAGRLLPADVLLAGLQRQPVGRRAVGVPGHPDQPAGQRPLQARRAPPGSRRAGRRSPSVRRTAGSCRPRCPRRSPPAPAAASAPAGRRPP